MKAWTIPVSWAKCGEVTVKASTLEEAMRIARDEVGELPIPSDGEYVDSSWTLSTEDEQFIRNYYNNNQSDDAE